MTDAQGRIIGDVTSATDPRFASQIGLPQLVERITAEYKEAGSPQHFTSKEVTTVDKNMVGKIPYLADHETMHTINEVFVDGEQQVPFKIGVAVNSGKNARILASAGRTKKQGQSELERSINPPLTAKAGQPFLLLPTSSSVNAYMTVPIMMDSYNPMTQGTALGKAIHKVLERVPTSDNAHAVEIINGLEELLSVQEIHINYNGDNVKVTIKPNGAESQMTIYNGDKNAPNIVEQLELGLQGQPFQVSRKYMNEDYDGQDYNRMIGEVAKVNLPIGTIHTVSDWFTVKPINAAGQQIKTKSPRSTGSNPYAASPQYVTITKGGMTLNVNTTTYEVSDTTGKVYTGPNANKVKALAFGQYTNKNMKQPYDTEWGYFDPKTDSFIERPKTQETTQTESVKEKLQRAIAEVAVNKANALARERFLSQRKEDAQNRKISQERRDNLVGKTLSIITDPSKTPEERINTLMWLQHNVNRGLQLTEEEREAINKSIEDLHKQGYTWDTLQEGGDYHEGMKVTADFVEDVNAPKGSAIITGIRTPQINKDGIMVQSGSITVTQGPDIDDSIASEEKPSLSPQEVSDQIQISNTSNGISYTFPVNEWNRKTSDIRTLPDGWGQKNGLTYYKYGTKSWLAGRGGDNVNVWFKSDPNDAVKRQIEEFVRQGRKLNDVDTLSKILNGEEIYTTKGTQQETPEQLEEKAKKAGLLNNKVRQTLWKALTTEQQAIIANKKGPKQKQWMDALEGAFNTSTNTFDETKLRGSVDNFLGRKGMYRRTDGSQSVWNRQRELGWLKRALPNLSTEEHLTIVDGLIEINDSENPGLAYGKFQEGMITISDVAARGTAYHEAFHAVVHTLLNNEEYQELFDAAVERWGNIDSVQLEENLAEDFRRFMQSEEDWYDSLDEKGYGTIRKTIAILFHKLKNLIKSKFWKTPYINKLYYNINRGKYARRKVKQSDATRFSKESLSTEMQSIKDKAIADGTFMKAPNGKPTNLNERQWLQVRTKAFKNWFGDWETNIEDKLSMEEIFDESTKELWYNADELLKLLENSKYKPIADLFRNQLSEFKELKVYGVQPRQEDEVMGVLLRTENTIYISSEHHEKGKLSEEELGTIVHEVIHSVTAHEYNNNPEFKEKIDELFTLARNDKDFGRVALRKKGYSSGDYYGYNNGREFIAEAFSNPAFAKILSNIKYNNSKVSIYDRFVALIKAIFGITTDGNSVLDELIRRVPPYAKSVKAEMHDDNVSKVVDENGEPLVVYHGTKYDFNTFSYKYFGTTDGGNSGKGFYFTPSKDIAEARYGKNGYVMPVFLNIRTPMEDHSWGTNPIANSAWFGRSKEETIEALQDQLNYMREDGADAEELKEAEELVNEFIHNYNNVQPALKGRDGVISYKKSGGIYEYVVAKSNQIKSATENVGDFDPNNPDIRYRMAEGFGGTVQEFQRIVDSNVNNPYFYRTRVEMNNAWGRLVDHWRREGYIVKGYWNTKTQKWTVASAKKIAPEGPANYKRIEQYHADKWMYDNLSQDNKSYLAERGITPTEYSRMTQLEKEVLFRCKY